MTIDDAKDWVARVRAVADDGERAHAEEDESREAFLIAVSKGECQFPAQCAEILLSTMELKFPRWCA